MIAVVAGVLALLGGIVALNRLALSVEHAADDYIVQHFETMNPEELRRVRDAYRAEARVGRMLLYGLQIGGIALICWGFSACKRDRATAESASD